jgi:hypothetical protein
MQMCDDKHSEVCFETRNCPVCEKIAEISNLEDKIYDLKEEVEELKSQL